MIYIYLGAVAGLLLIVWLLLHFFVFAKKKRTKLVKSIDRKFQYYHALLTGSCLSIITRLEVISHMNLVYSTYHLDFFKRYKEILDKKDKIVENDIYSLNDYLADDKKKGFKEAYKVACHQLDSYVELVDRLNDDLIKIIKPEEEVNEKSVRVKEYLNETRKKYLSIQSNIRICVPTFDKVFRKIDKEFDKFNDFVNSANYEDATIILGPIDKVLDELNIYINKSPDLCLCFENEIPLLISSLRLKYDEEVSKGVPLYAFVTDNSFYEFDKTIQKIKSLLVNLKINEAANYIDNVKKEISTIDSLIDKELNDKQLFEQKFAETYKHSDLVEKKAIKVYNNIANIEQYYLFNASYSDIATKLLGLSNELTTSKRKIDTLYHAAVKQPYSILLEKINDLDKKTNSLEKYLEDFNAYVIYLKKECDSSYNLIFSSIIVLKQKEVSFHKLHLEEELDEKYSFIFNRCYTLLNEVFSLLSTKPINVEQVDKLINEFRLNYDNLNSDIDYLIDIKNKCIALMLATNEMRNGFSDLDTKLDEAENLFIHSHFKESFEILTNIAEKHSIITNRDQL